MLPDLTNALYSPVSATREVARMIEKIAATRRRVWTLAVLRAALGGCWAWLVSLLALGTLCAYVPMPVSLRLAALILHCILIAAGVLGGLRYAVSGKLGIRALRLRTWALHCEELHPTMKGSLVTCIDLAEEGGRAAFDQNPVALALLKDTARRFAAFEPMAAVPPRRYALAQLGIAMPIAALGMLALCYPAYTRTMFGALYHYDLPAIVFGAGQPGSAGLAVTPGDVEVPRGSAVEVEAQFTLQGDQQRVGAVSLRTTERSEKGPNIRTYPMLKDEKRQGVFHLVIRDVNNPLEYQVNGEVESTRPSAARSKPRLLQSKSFKITPYDPPEIELIHSSIRLPAYTGLPEQQVDGTFISALEGSSVTVRVRSNHPLQSATLASTGEAPLQGRIDANGDDLQKRTAEFSLTVSHEQSLVVHLRDQANRENVNPPTLTVHLQEDAAPVVKVKRPGADWSVHRIAEVALDLEAVDDFGLRDVSLEYRINDAAPVSVPLYTHTDGQPPLAHQALTHTFMLEDMNLEVGDSIYYRFIAHDMRPVVGQPNQDDKSTGYSQPYFLTIRPFEQIYRKSASGGSAASEGVPNVNERAIIVATTRLVERWARLTDAERKTALDDIVRAQRDVRSGVERLKMKLSPEVPDYAKRIAHLDAAAVDMRKAEAVLGGGFPAEALAPENSALRHVIAAVAGLPLEEAMQSEGMPSPYPPDPPTSLSGQKTEARKGKYELSDKASGAKRDKALLEATETVRALARRQKEFMETLKREEPPTGSGSASVGANYADSIKKAEDSERELQRLRESANRLADADEKLAAKFQQAIESVSKDLAKMRDALQNKDSVKAQGDNARAMDSLRELERNLDKALREKASARLEALKERLDDWIARQNALKGESAKLGGPAKQGEVQPSRSSLSDQQRQLGNEMKQAMAALAAAEAGSGGSGGAGSGGSSGSGGSASGANSSQQSSAGQTSSGQTQAANGQAQAGAEPGTAQSAPRPAQDRLNEASEESEAAAQDLGAGRDRTVAKRQAAVLTQLQSVREAVQQMLDTVPNDAGNRLERALEAVKEMKQSLRQPGAGEPSKGDRVPDHPWAPQPPGAPPTGPFQHGMDTLRETMGQDPQAGPLIQTLVNGPTGPPPDGQAGEPGQQGAGDSGRVAPDYALMPVLDSLEELLEQRLQLEDQAQRLQQTPPDELPPRFREMASKYFEALGANAASRTTANTGVRHGNNQ